MGMEQILVMWECMRSKTMNGFKLAPLLMVKQIVMSQDGLCRNQLTVAIGATRNDDNGPNSECISSTCLQMIRSNLAIFT